MSKKSSAKRREQRKKAKALSGALELVSYNGTPSIVYPINVVRKRGMSVILSKRIDKENNIKQHTFDVWFSNFVDSQCLDRYQESPEDSGFVLPRACLLECKSNKKTKK